MDDGLRTDLERVLGNLRHRVTRSQSRSRHGASQNHTADGHRYPSVASRSPPPMQRSARSSPPPRSGSPQRSWPLPGDATFLVQQHLHYSSPNAVPLSRGESLDREIQSYYSVQRGGAAASPSQMHCDGSGIGPEGSPSFIDTVMDIAEQSGGDPDQSEALISKMIHGGVSVPLSFPSPRVDHSKRLKLMRVPCRVAGALLELALRREWNSNRLTDIALKLIDSDVTAPTLRYRAELEEFMSPEEVLLLINTSFNLTHLTMFLYGHFMGHRSWNQMGVPNELLAGRRETAELLDHTLRFNMHTALARDGYSYVRSYTRDGLPSVEKATTRSVCGVVWQLPPQAMLLAISHMPNTSLQSVNVRVSKSYVQKRAVMCTSQYKATGLSPSQPYLRAMTDAGSDILPESYLSELRAMAKDAPDSQPSQSVRHKNLVLSRAFKKKKAPRF